MQFPPDGKFYWIPPEHPLHIPGYNCIQGVHYGTCPWCLLHHWLPKWERQMRPKGPIETYLEPIPGWGADMVTAMAERPRPRTKRQGFLARLFSTGVHTG